MRFRPYANATGHVSLEYRAWDQTQGAAGSLLGVSVEPASAFSSSKASLAFEILPSNDAPAWSSTSLSFPSPLDDTIEHLFASYYQDAEGAPLGVAAVGSSGAGAWQFDRGAGWQPLGTLCDVSARLLTGSDKIRFLPASNFAGEATFSAQCTSIRHADAPCSGHGDRSCLKRP